MSAVTTPTDNVFMLTTKERVRFEEQFRELGPSNGFVTGEQCRTFFMLSQLPTPTLGKIWGLADRDADGKMNLDEFLIACKLISIAVRGYEIPVTIPPHLIASLKLGQPSPITPAIPPLIPPQPPSVVTSSISQPLPSMHNNNVMNQSTPLIQPIPKPPSLPIQQQPMRDSNSQPSGGMNSAPYMSPASTIPHSLKTVASVPTMTDGGTPQKVFEKGASLDLNSKSTSDWAIPQQSLQNYGQLFQTVDKMGTGYLTTIQAKNILIRSKLPQHILAQIWTLSDLDVDGKLSAEEFAIAMFLCERAKSGHMPPHVLPPDLIPPSYRKSKTRHASISSQGGSMLYHNKDHESTTSLNLATSFEDKRKENYEKGQAELDRRRKSLMEVQRKEIEERERKEREEIERRERARLEAERRRQMELEAQLREKEELERAKEEERRRQLEQKEQARREMERQRQLEIENQRIQELQQQKEKEQENILKLKAKNQSLSIDLSQLNDQVKNISQKICETRIGVNNVKTVIDGMRLTRDNLNRDSAQLKGQLKEQNAKLLTNAQERTKLEARLKTADTKEMAIKQLQAKIAEMEKEIELKTVDINNNNVQVAELNEQMSTLIGACETIYNKYEEKRNRVLQKRNSVQKTDDLTAPAWATDNENNATDWPSSGPEWPTLTTNSASANIGTSYTKYRALYEFVARTGDEVSFQPGDIISVPTGQKGEPGWLYGEIRGSSGWFPEAYVERSDGNGVIENNTQVLDSNHGVNVMTTQLEGIDEVSESTSDINEPISKPTDLNFITAAVAETKLESEPEPNRQPESELQEYYVSSYRYQSDEPGDLNFNAGDIILVTKKDGEWWTGKINDTIGIFPSNYVQQLEPQLVESIKLNDSIKDTVAADNEVSEINANKNRLPDFDNMSYTSQTGKGKKPEIASVIAPYDATSSEQLILQRGQLVLIRKKTDSGWWEGELQAKGRKKQVGWFPSTYVKILSSSGRSSGRTTPISSGKMFHEIVIDKVVALYAYKASNPDELTFAKGDIISVTSKNEGAWWRGELDGVSGLFPSQYVGPLKSLNEAFLKKRNEYVTELIMTEKSYVDDLNVIHKLFEKTLRDTRAISDSDSDCIFHNLNDILHCNRRFLKALLNRQESGYDIYGDIISDYIPKMTCYIKFCSNQLNSSNRLDYLSSTSVTFREQLRKIQNNPATKKMPLSAFLIKPMQRITKYPLLLKNILENTPTDSSGMVFKNDLSLENDSYLITFTKASLKKKRYLKISENKLQLLLSNVCINLRTKYFLDHHLLKEALHKAENFCKQINENVRQTDNKDKLNWIQKHVFLETVEIDFDSDTNCLGPRKLLHFGILNKMKSGKELICFLFNDFLLLTQLINKPVTNKRFIFQQANGHVLKMYKNVIFIEDLNVLNKDEDTSDVLEVCDSNGTVTYQLQATNHIELSAWLKVITEAKSEFTKNESFRLKHMSKVDNQNFHVYGRLLIQIQNGKLYGSLHKIGEVFCHVSMNEQVQKTDPELVVETTTGSGSAKEYHLTWNSPMQFLVRSLKNDVLHIIVYERKLFSPNNVLDSLTLRLQDLSVELSTQKVPIVRNFLLDNSMGNLEIKLYLKVYEK